MSPLGHFLKIFPNPAIFFPIWESIRDPPSHQFPLLPRVILLRQFFARPHMIGVSPTRLICLACGQPFTLSPFAGVFLPSHATPLPASQAKASPRGYSVTARRVASLLSSSVPSAASGYRPVSSSPFRARHRTSPWALPIPFVQHPPSP